MFLTLPFRSAFIEYNMDPVAKRTMPIRELPTDKSIRLVEMNLVLEKSSNAELV
jgi:hypothetical protein